MIEIRGGVGGAFSAQAGAKVLLIRQLLHGKLVSSVCEWLCFNWLFWELRSWVKRLPRLLFAAGSGGEAIIQTFR